MLRGLLLGIFVLITAAVVVGFLLPNSARLERSIVIERPPSTVFTVLNGFRHLKDWSPWTRMDPAMQGRAEGPTSGVGARYVWTSTQEQVGSGSQEIVESVPYERIAIRLVFSGMESSNLARFEITPQGEATKVVWSYETEFGSSLLGRYFGLMLERMIGPDYERGLAQLKAHVETLPASDFSDVMVETVEVVAMPIAYVSGRSNTRPADIARAYAAAYAKLSSALSREGIKPAGPVLAIGRSWDADRGVYEFDAAVPVPSNTKDLGPDREIKLGQTYAGTVLKTTHRGSYSGLGAHLQKLMAYKAALGMDDNGAPWDVYVSDASKTRESELITETYVPVR